MLKTEEEEEVNRDVCTSTDHEHHRNISLDKSLSASLDSLDNLFCRRCLVLLGALFGYCWLDWVNGNMLISAYLCECDRYLIVVFMATLSLLLFL